MKRFTSASVLASLALLTTCGRLEPVGAQDMPLSPELVSSYAALGAATMTLRYVQSGDRRKACFTAQHQVVLSRAADSDTANAQSLVNKLCGPLY
jgi:hypothetical protein